MNSLLKKAILLLLSFCFYNSFSQNNYTKSNLTLFSDRDFCISGDSVWFKARLPENLEQFGNIVRIQFETATGNVISVVSKKATNGWAEGYFVVPDSLSTGQCFLFAFLNAERKINKLQLKGKSLFVYNRFENQISRINLLPYMPLSEKSDDKGIQINTNKESFSTREEVKVNLQINSGIDLAGAVVKATLVDPLTSEISGRMMFNVENSNPAIPDFIENDGVLINGVVRDDDGNLQPNTLVFLSITNDPPYFDYCYTGNKGDFHFFLKDAVGTAKIVLQLIPEEGKEYHLEIENDYLTRANEKRFQTKNLTLEQIEFIDKLIQANYIHRIFNPVLSVAANYLSMPNRFSVPFYGIPTRRVIPDEFVDLPDFREISRELLPGMQYRIRKNEITIRMTDLNQNSYFEKEPLRLLNGIPVFKNNILAKLKSADIKYIDIVQNERIFGDYKLSGVLSVSLYDKSNFWMNQVSGIYEFNMDLLQPDKEPKYQFIKNNDMTVPDFRRIYFWQKLDDINNNFSFKLSDIQGKVEISVEGLTNNNTLYKTSKIIEVK